MAETRPSGLIERLDKLNEEEKPCVKGGAKYLSAKQTADLACPSSVEPTSPKRLRRLKVLLRRMDGFTAGSAAGRYLHAKCFRFPFVYKVPLFFGKS